MTSPGREGEQKVFAPYNWLDLDRAFAWTTIGKGTLVGELVVACPVSGGHPDENKAGSPGRPVGRAALPN
jgi:hypothetical protein